MSSLELALAKEIDRLRRCMLAAGLDPDRKGNHMPAFCTRKTSHSYFVVMIDFGKKGLEAIVHPEDTRRDIVSQLANGESKHVVFIHHVDGLYIEDVTNELFDEAEAIARDEKVSPWVREVQAMDAAE